MYLAYGNEAYLQEGCTAQGDVALPCKTPARGHASYQGEGPGGPRQPWTEGQRPILEHCRHTLLLGDLLAGAYQPSPLACHAAYPVQPVEEARNSDLSSSCPSLARSLLDSPTPAHTRHLPEAPQFPLLVYSIGALGIPIHPILPSRGITKQVHLT